jgi:UDP-glucose 4-epimerase
VNILVTGGIPNNLMPNLPQVFSCQGERAQMFGNDDPTLDGTGARDFLHVMDLADAHVRSLSLASEPSGCDAINLGTGRGTSVLELVHAFEHATGVSIPLDIVEWRCRQILGRSGQGPHLPRSHAARSLADMWADSSRRQN